VFDFDQYSSDPVLQKDYCVAPYGTFSSKDTLLPPRLKPSISAQLIEIVARGSMKAPWPKLRLDSGDRVRVIVFGQDNLSRVYSVDGSGSIALPLIGPIRARGLTTFQLAGDIPNELKRNMSRIRKSPSRSRPIGPSSSSESSTSPANIPMSRRWQWRLRAIAEGYTERAKQRMVRLTRRFGGVMSTVMVPTDYPVQPGDTIYVLERFF
jgi:polysaccharide biosynthesis/export protein